MNVYDLPDVYESDVNCLETIMESGAVNGPDYRPMVLKIQKTTKLEDREVGVGEVGGLEEWEEDQTDAETSFQELFETRWVQKEYSSKIKVGRLAQRFWMYDFGKLSKLAEKHGKAAYKSIQRIALEPFSKALDSTYVSGYTDGKRPASALHPLSPGSSTTYSNILTSSPALDYQPIKDAIALLDAMPDDRGEAMHLGIEGYVIITTNWTDYLNALAIVDPAAVNQAGSANYNVNQFAGKTLRGVKGRPIDVLYLPYASNTTYPNLWAVMAKGEVYAKLKEVYDYETSRFKNDDTGSMFVRGSTMFAVKVVDPKVIVFSAGDGTTSVNW